MHMHYENEISNKKKRVKKRKKKRKNMYTSKTGIVKRSFFSTASQMFTMLSPAEVAIVVPSALCAIERIALV